MFEIKTKTIFADLFNVWLFSAFKNAPVGVLTEQSVDTGSGECRHGRKGW